MRASTSRSRWRCTCSTSSRASTRPTRGSRTSSTRARSGSSRASTRTARSSTSRRAPTSLWRKNRQPNAGSSAVGTDLNRNWGFQWGCCGGSSGTFSSETYRGAAPFSAPETTVVRNFVQSRRTCATSAACSRSRPASTSTRTPSSSCGRTATRPPTRPRRCPPTCATRSRRLARTWPATNGYTPEQASDLYIADGAIDDWLWGVEGIFGYTFEMYPVSLEPRLLSARRGHPGADVAQPRGRAAAARDLRLRVPRDRQGDAVLRHREHDGLLRRLRDEQGLARRARPTRPRSAAGSAATRRRRTPAAPSSSARR